MSDKEKKLREIEKKRLKAQQKKESKRLKDQYEEDKRKLKEKAELQKLGIGPDAPEEIKKQSQKLVSTQKPIPEPVPWYKDPAWVRAIAAIASLIVAIIALIITFVL